MSEVSCPRSTRPSGKMRCCCQISIAENYIVFDAKITPRNHMKKQNIITALNHFWYHCVEKNISQNIFYFPQKKVTLFSNDFKISKVMTEFSFSGELSL